MSGTIFVIGDDNSLTRLSRIDYDSEDLFQRLLADHPLVAQKLQEQHITSPVIEKGSDKTHYAFGLKKYKGEGEL